jgi:site-specific DNA-methyltransferase (adenine-specific)
MTATTTTATTATLEIKISDEYEKLVPRMPHNEFQELQEDIRQNRQQDEIDVNEKGIVLDGHHRFTACKQLGIPVKYRITHFKNELEEKRFIIRRAQLRRHLNDFQKAELAHEDQKIESELAKLRMSAGGKGGLDTNKVCSDEHPLEEGKTRDIIAKRNGLTPTTYQRAKTVIEKAPEQVKERLRRGKTTIAKEYNQIQLEEKQQKKRAGAEQAAKGLNLPSKVILLNKDSRKVEELPEIPDNSADLILTDPAYSKDSLDQYEALAKLSPQKLKEGGSVVFYFGELLELEIQEKFKKYAGNNLKYWGQIYVKHESSFNGTMDYQRGVSFAGKRMLWFVKGEKRLTDQVVANYIQSSIPDKSKHLWAQSPVEAEYLINKLTVSEHSLVVDPFLGSGAFGVAAIKLGRYFVGIEIDKETFDRANNYLKMEAAAK